MPCHVLCQPNPSFAWNGSWALQASTLEEFKFSRSIWIVSHCNSDLWYLVIVFVARGEWHQWWMRNWPRISQLPRCIPHTTSDCEATWRHFLCFSLWWWWWLLLLLIIVGACCSCLGIGACYGQAFLATSANKHSWTWWENLVAKWSLQGSEFAHVLFKSFQVCLQELSKMWEAKLPQEQSLFGEVTGWHTWRFATKHRHIAIWTQGLGSRHTLSCTVSSHLCLCESTFLLEENISITPSTSMRGDLDKPQTLLWQKFDWCKWSAMKPSKMPNKEWSATGAFRFQAGRHINVSQSLVERASMDSYRKLSYLSVFFSSSEKLGCPSPLGVWCFDMFWSQESMFTACSACTFLKNMLDKTPRSQTDVLGAIRKRLGQTAPCDGHAITHS